MTAAISHAANLYPESSGAGAVTDRCGSLNSRLAGDGPGSLVRADAEKRRVAQMAVGGPLDETDLRDDLRLEPAHLFHLLRRHPTAPVRGLAARQVGERTAWRMQRRQRRRHLAADVRREPGTNLPGEVQRPSRVIADEQRVDP